MARLYFRFGAMGSSKTANALMVVFNYEEKGLRPLLLKPKIESRDGEQVLRSRIGLERACEFFEDYFLPDINETKKRLEGYDAVIIDEVQFCDPKLIPQMYAIVHDMELPVICYGLKTDFQLRPFPASLELAAIADVVQELKTVCWCGNGANCNARIDGRGNVVRDGAQVVIGGNESYISLCYAHYKEGNIGPKMRAKYQGAQG
ncbi:MAG: thymidine kinase [Lachnospiraceae bacterium]|nr:thymidine kinase [Lachnospiraceae bacterium]